MKVGRIEQEQHENSSTWLQGFHIESFGGFWRREGHAHTKRKQTISDGVVTPKRHIGIDKISPYNNMAQSFFSYDLISCTYYYL